MDTIVIGGKSIQANLTYKQYQKFLQKYYLMLEEDKRLKNLGKTLNWNMFFFWSIWKCIKKRGIWPFRYPFRSMAHMINSLLYEEYDIVINYVNNKIAEKVEREGRELKNAVKN